VFEARAIGADALLRIVAALEQDRLVALQQLAWDLGLAVLVEVHDSGEMRRAADAGARLIGVNNRNLRTLSVAVDASHELAAMLPPDVVGISESGLRNHADLQRLRSEGYKAFLIGERFMTAADPADALRDLMGGGAGPC
jgi:indole-3-glycerol phosphate synthase